MIKISYDAVEFNHPYTINGNNMLKCNWSDLVRACVTVGKKNNFNLWKNGIFSIFEVQYREYLIYAILKRTNNGFLTKSKVYIDADPSEKGFNSYYVGNVMTKLFSEKLLGVTWLLHLDVYRDELFPFFMDGSKKKPDFVGLNKRRNFVILESKGISGNYREKIISDGKEQTKYLRNLNGALPDLRAVIKSYYENDSLTVKLHDPPDFYESAIDIELNLEKYIKNYYSLFLNIDEKFFEPRVINEETFLMIKSCELYSRVGIHKGTFELLKENPKEFLGNFNVIKSYSDDLISIGGDGIVVILSKMWSEK